MNLRRLPGESEDGYLQRIVNTAARRTIELFAGLTPEQTQQLTARVIDCLSLVEFALTPIRWLRAVCRAFAAPFRKHRR